jgi:hypothetical protein
MAKQHVIPQPSGAPVPKCGLSIEQVSERYGIPVPTLRRWRLEGPVAGPVGVLVGGQLRYLPVSLERWDQKLADRWRAAEQQAEALLDRQTAAR